MKVSNSTEKDLALFTRPIDPSHQQIAGAAIKDTVSEMFEDGELQQGLVEFAWNTAVFILSSQKPASSRDGFNRFVLSIRENNRACF